MMRQLLRSSTFVVIVAQFVSTLSKLGIFISLMQLGNASVAGSYTLSLAIITPVFLMFSFSLREIYVTHQGNPKYSDFLKLRIYSSLIGIIIVGLIGIIFYTDSWHLITSMGLYRFTELLVDIRIAHFQRKGQYFLMAYSTLALSIATSLAIITSYYFTNSLLLSLLNGTLAAAMVFLLVSFAGVEKAKTDTSFQFETINAKEIYHQGFMLSTSSFAVSLGTNIPVLLLGSFHSATTVGIYSSIYNIMSVSNILFSSITQIELRGFSEQVKEQNFKRMLERGRQVVLFLSLFSVFGAAVIILTGRSILSLVFDQDFSDYLIPLIIMAMTICIAPLGFILDAQLTALHQFSTQGKLSLFTLGFTVIVAILLIPKFGIIGGTTSVFLTMLVRNILKLVVLKNVTQSHL